MLIISRKKNEKIMIGDDIEVVIVDTGKSRVRLGVRAPKGIPIQSIVVAVSQGVSAADPAPVEPPPLLPDRAAAAIAGRPF